MKKSGFTLAEVLITLGIIGIVAAITLPNFIVKYQNHVTISRLKKCYNQLSQSALYAIQDTINYSDLLGYSDGAQPGFWYKIFSDKMQITKTCINKAGCWNNSTKCLNDKAPAYYRGNIGIGNDIIIFNTTDNYTYNLDGYSIADTKNLFGVNSKYNSLIIFVDINGKNKPNIIGKDIFVFVFSDKGFVPAGHDQTDNIVNNNCSSSGNGYFCLEKIIRNSWEIKY